MDRIHHHGHRAAARPGLNPYAAIARRLADDLRPRDQAREEALTLARNLTRLAGHLMRGLHRGVWPAAEARSLESVAQELRVVLGRHASLATHGAVEQALGEYVEALQLRAFLNGEAIPRPARLRVPPAAYLLGLVDTVGELRRVVLARLLRGDVEGAEHAFDSMEKLYEALLDADVPERVLALRPKLDSARAIVERTRGDLVTGKRAKELERKIDGVGRLLDEAEGRPPKRAPRRPTDDLDLDAAWNKD